MRTAYTRALIAASAVLVLVIIGIVSTYALLTVIIDGITALIVVLPPAMAGLWLVPLFRAGQLPMRWHLLLGAALGLGAYSLLILVLGLAGALDRTVWVPLHGLCGIAGVLRLRAIFREDAARSGLTGDGKIEARPTRADVQTDAPTTRPNDETALGAWRYLWLLIIPFACLSLLAASNAPGTIWSEEGLGYDVLEYHLQMPKEYFVDGRISYAPHNVYANFPAAVEMYYLLAMVILDDPIAAAVPANFIHTAFAAFAFFAAWCVGRDHSRSGGIIGALCIWTAGWMPYLCGLAYVENGLLFYGITATGIVLRLVRSTAPSTPMGIGASVRSESTWGSSLRWLALAGLIAGFACGCKYTAIPMIAIPLTVAVLMLPARSSVARVSAAGVFGLMTLVGFSPWLVKNVVMTGNPVFPLANTLFQAAPDGWGEAETDRWAKGHDVAPEERRLPARLRAAFVRTVGDEYQRFGPMVFLLALGGMVYRRLGRADAVLMMILAMQVMVWIFFTHVYARFAVVMLIPLCILAARSTNGAMVRDALRMRIVFGLLLVGGAFNAVFATRLAIAESPNGAPPVIIHDGQLPQFEYFKVVNLQLPKDAFVLVVGDARAFYFQRRIDYRVVFNRGPFVDVLRNAPSDEAVVDWLRDRGYTHILVNWSEINRLRRSRYGFATEITPVLFDRLVDAGLEWVSDFVRPPGIVAYASLFEVPPR